MRLLKKVAAITLFTITLSACVTDPELYTQQDKPQEQTRDLNDIDLDGVINERDLCAETPNDAVINNDGCPELTGRPKVKYRIIYFGFDKSTLSENENNRTIEIATFLNKYPETSLYLIGDTSEVGSEEYNEKLAMRRIDTVHELLVSNGVESSRLNKEVYAFKNHLPDYLTGRQTRLIAVLQWPADTKDYEVEWTIFSEKNKKLLN
jgi:outer membrane protein OmpA-like peptidoglycan-associated protein